MTGESTRLVIFREDEGTVPRLAEAIHAVDDACCEELPENGQCETCTARAVVVLRIVVGGTP